MKSIYIHIPFCNKICSYCDFCKMYYNEKLVNDYLDALEKEIESRYKGEVIETIYVGGGTPSSLSLKQLKRLFSIINKFNLNIKEFTFECNIDSIDEEKLIILKENGITRISIGIETINKNILKSINRYHTKDNIIKKINLVSKYFSNINVDLMYGFKDESIDVLKDDLNFILSLPIKHISLYSLILEEHTMFYINGYERLSEDIDREMYDLIHDALEKESFKQYEISNYSLSSYESIHNKVYWNNEEYYGFGLSSGSYIDNKRMTNTRSINNYIRGKYLLEEESLSIKDKMSYEAILGLRKVAGINLDDFYNKYGVKFLDVFDIMDLVNKNILVINNNYIYINREYFYVSNQILERFLEVVDE